MSSAHEIFYDGSSPNWNPIPLEWNEKVSGKAHLKMNGDYLSVDYSTHYATVSSEWPAASSKVSVTDTTFSTSKVDLATPTAAYWDGRFGIYYSTALGICDMTSTDGKQLDTAANAKSSSGKINYAAIFLTPYISSYDWSLFDSSKRPNHIKATMVHEIGHALGLGHPNTSYYPVSDNSIMRQGTGYGGYISPQTHDIDDLTSKY